MLPIRDLLVLTVTFVASVAALLQPSTGLLAYVGYAALNPQGLTWDLAQTFPHSKVIAVATILGCVISSKTKTFPRQRESILLLAIWGMLGISTVFAYFPVAAQNDFIIMSKILLMTFLTTLLIDSEKRLSLLLTVIGIGLGLLALKIGIFVVLTGGHSPVEGPEGTYIQANNTVGMAIAMNVPILFYLSRVESRKWLRLAIWGMILCSYPAVAGTFSRGDWIGLALITLLMVMKTTRNKFLAVVAASMMAIMAIVLVPMIVSKAMVDRYETLVNYEEDNSAESRFWNWEFCKRIGLAHPVTGAGFKFYSSQLYEKYYPEFIARWGEGKRWACHNTYLTVFAEHGALTFLLWIGLLASVFLSLRQIRRAGRAHPEAAWMIDYANMIWISLVGFMVMGTFVDLPYYELFYQLVAATIVAKQLIPSKELLVHSTAIRSDVNIPLVTSADLRKL